MVVPAACCLHVIPDIQLAVDPAYDRSWHHCATTVQRCACLPGVSLPSYSQPRKNTSWYVADWLQDSP